MEFTSRQLRAFHLVAQRRSFTRAAEALFITPSGLSLLIRELENQLGFRLFNRTTRYVTLTEYGNQLFAITQRNLLELDRAMSQIGRTAKGGSQSISVGTTPLVAANILPLAIKEFQSQRPEVRIQLFDGEETEVLKRVESGKLDMALGMFKRVPDVRRIPFFRFSLLLIRPDKEGVLPRSSARWSALNGQTMISRPASNSYQQVIDEHLSRNHVAWQRGLVVNLLDTQIALVEADLGIAIIPSFGLPVCRERRVAMSRLIDPVVNLEFYQINSRGKKLPPGADEFTAYLKAYIARWAGRAGVVE